MTRKKNCSQSKLIFTLPNRWLAWRLCSCSKWFEVGQVPLLLVKSVIIYSNTGRRLSRAFIYLFIWHQRRRATESSSSKGIQVGENRGERGNKNRRQSRCLLHTKILLFFSTDSTECYFVSLEFVFWKCLHEEHLLPQIQTYNLNKLSISGRARY